MTVSKVKFVEVDETHDGQRIDNFLLAHFSKVPKSRIYRALRSGEVRVNKGRIKPTYRVQIGDIVRLPPIEFNSPNQDQRSSVSEQRIQQLENEIIFENEYLLVINKPAGIAVHSGSGDHIGVIEVMRASRIHQPFLELAHRIDKETSGCLVLAKSRRALLDVQSSLHAANAQKDYVFLAQGRWQIKQQSITHALASQSEKSGAKVVVSEQGKQAHTIISTREILAEHSLMSASILTGRTHQIRVHAQQEGHPVAGDKRYGNFAYNRAMQKYGLKRMFLHAEHLKLHLESLSQTLEFHAPLPEELKKVCKQLRKGG